MTSTFPDRSNEIGPQSTQMRRPSFSMVFAIAGVAVVMGGFRYQIAGLDPTTNLTLAVASPTLYVVEGAFLIWAAWVALTRLPVTLKFVRSVWPLFLLPLMALVSITWSVNPSKSATEALHYLLCFFVPVAAIMVAKDEPFEFVYTMLSSIVILSVINVVLFPSYGVHQMTDSSQSVHAGQWRGMFSHRTAFGYAAAMASIVSIIRLQYKGWSWRNGMMAGLCLLCVAAADSAGSIIVLLCSVIGMSMVKFAAMLPKPQRAGIFVLAFLIIPAAAVALPYADAALGLFGKEPTLTGRTSIWDAILAICYQNPFTGLGYFAGLNDVVIPRLRALDFVAPNGQGAYMESWIAFGPTGVAIIAGFEIWLVAKAMIRVFSIGKRNYTNLRADRRDASLLLCVCIMICVSTLLESFLIQSDQVVMPVTVMILMQLFADERLREARPS